MERNKLETQIKSLLANREIQPSTDAFEKLQGMLIEKEVKKNVTFTWVALAASFLVFITLGYLLLTPKPATIPAGTVVEIKRQETIKQSIKEYQKNAITAVQTNNSTLSNKKEDTILSQKNAPVILNIAEESLPVTNITNEKDVKLETIAVVDPEKTISSGIKSKITVDPKLLLSKVEGELDLSFRDKVLTKINKNYQEVKVVVATRNQQ